MAIKPETVVDSLKRGLRPLYVLVGDEHLLAQEAGDAIRAAARAAGYGGEGERSIFVVDQWFKWDELRGATLSMGLFAQKT
jgi:DNA polymerase III subunit delta